MTLPNNQTSDIQLNNWGQKYIKGFRGVINRNDIDKYAPNMKGGQSLIINLDPGYHRGGTHWTSLRYSSESPYIAFYKDSFGMVPPDNIIKSVHNSGRHIIYGNNIYQKLKEQNCGKRAAYFLRDMSNASDNNMELEYFENLEK
jgi:hypothetical protein